MAGCVKNCTSPCPNQSIDDQLQTANFHNFFCLKKKEKGGKKKEEKIETKTYFDHQRLIRNQGDRI